MGIREVCCEDVNLMQLVQNNPAVQFTPLKLICGIKSIVMLALHCFHGLLKRLLSKRPTPQDSTCMLLLSELHIHPILYLIVLIILGELYKL
jgi:hypothetical protein